MGTIKDRNGKDLTETEEIKKTWQEYKEEPYKKGLNDIDNYDGVVTNLDTLQYEVKWALGSITMNKASGGGGIPAELFKVLVGKNLVHLLYLFISWHLIEQCSPVHVWDFRHYLVDVFHTF